MEWQVVSTIVVLVGLFFTIGKPILEFANKVQQVIDNLAQHQQRIETNANKLDEHDKALQEHEIRIHDLEQENN